MRAWRMRYARFTRKLRECGPLDAEIVALRWFPDEPLRIVPLAIGLATVMQSAEAAILLAANAGGDSD
jgi:hypothetical protein